MIVTDAMVEAAKSVLDNFDLEFQSEDFVKIIVKGMLTAALAHSEGEPS